jgi:hypothetical protein
LNISMLFPPLIPYLYPLFENIKMFLVCHLFPSYLVCVYSCEYESIERSSASAGINSPSSVLSRRLLPFSPPASPQPLPDVRASG